jgi:eukaryotic-like serine/threonine-protein kinase
MAGTLSNLGETSSNIGQYDQAVDYYLKDLDLQRKMDDQRGVAGASAGLGTVYEYQGRYGAALAAQQDAVKTLQALGGNPPELPQIMAAEGNALTLVGRWGEAEKALDEALSRARELKDDSVIAEILGFQGDNFFYRGDFKPAERLFAQALGPATRGKDRSMLLISKFNLAKVGIKSGRSRQAAGTLKALAQEADTMGLRFISVEASVYLAEAFLDIKDYPHAREELERALGRSDKLGLRSLVARSHFLLAETLTRAGNGAEATLHYAEARRILAEIQKEVGNDSVLKRSDLSPIAAEHPARPGAGPA